MRHSMPAAGRTSAGELLLAGANSTSGSGASSAGAAGSVSFAVGGSASVGVVVVAVSALYSKGADEPLGVSASPRCEAPAAAEKS